MKRLIFVAIALVVFGAAVLGFQVQQQGAQAQRGQRGQRGQNAPQPTAAGQPGQPAPNADPYANNAAPGATTFPLAAPAGKDSNAKSTAPAGAVNQGPFDPAKWKYGPAFDPPAGAKIWNPVKLKLMQGGKVTGGTLFSAT